MYTSPRKNIGYVPGKCGMLLKKDRVQQVGLLLIAFDDKTLYSYGYVEAEYHPKTSTQSENA
jgi:hypothetical protein